MTVAPAARAWLPLLTGIAVAAALRAEAAVTATLKWPNDVLVDDRKIAGILAEAHGDAIVAGVGLNVTLTRAELPVPTATSLLLENAACLDRERLLAAILTELASRYTAWTAGPDPAALRAEYLRWCVTVGRQVRVELPGGAAAGRHGHRRGRDRAGSPSGPARAPRWSARATSCTSADVRVRHLAGTTRPRTPFRATMCAMSMEGQLPPGERRVLTLHPHWKILLRPLVLLVVVIAAAVALVIVIPPGREAGPGRIAVGVVAVVLAVAASASHSCAGRPRRTSSPPGGSSSATAS